MQLQIYFQIAYLGRTFYFACSADLMLLSIFLKVHLNILHVIRATQKFKDVDDMYLNNPPSFNHIGGLYSNKDSLSAKALHDKLHSQ